MNVRVGTTERNQVQELLSKAEEEGYLDLTEYEQRTTVAISARTVAELAGLLADLPPRFRWHPRQQLAPATSPPQADRDTHLRAITSLVLGIFSVPLSICFGVGALFGVAAMVLSRPGLRSSSDYGKALTGLVVGAVGTLLSVAMITLYLLVTV